MNTPVSGGAVSDAQLDAIRKKYEVLNFPVDWYRDFARDAIALTQPAVPVLASEPDGEVYSASCDYATVQWFKPNDKAGGDPKNSWSWPIKGTKVYLAAPLASEPEPVAAPTNYSNTMKALLDHEFRKGYIQGQIDMREQMPEPVAAEQARHDSCPFCGGAAEFLRPSPEKLPAAAQPEPVAEERALLEIDALLAQYHAEVWNAAEGTASVDYDMAGVETAKQLRTAIAALIGKEASKS